MQIRFIVFLTLVLQFSCYKTDHEVVNLNGNKIDVLGHAGMGISNSYPINSFESISYALALGADGTEIDIQMTKEGVLVAFHDQFLENSTNKEGIISDQNWVDIKGGFYTTIPYHDYKIIRLETLFEHTENLSDFRFALDCKLYTETPDSIYLQQYASAIVNLLEQYDLPSQTIIESPELKLFEFIRKETSEFELFWYTSNILTNLAEAQMKQLHGFTIRDNQVSEEEIKAAHENGFQVALYNTQTKKENISAIEKNPDIIQTDKLKHLLKVLK